MCHATTKTIDENRTKINITIPIRYGFLTTVASETFCLAAFGFIFGLVSLNIHASEIVTSLSTNRLVVGSNFTASAYVTNGYGDIIISMEWSGAGISGNTNGTNSVSSDVSTKTNTGGPITIRFSADGNETSCSVMVVCVESLAVVSGATQSHVTVSNNWAAVKTNANAVVEVTTFPNTNDAWELVSWTGGSNVLGVLNQRTVAKDVSLQSNITASAGASLKAVTIWIIWGTVRILTDDTTPTNAIPFGMSCDGTENLGAIIYTNTSGILTANAKVIPYAQLTPAGITAIP